MLSDEDAGRLADRLLAFWMEGDDDRASAAIDRLADVFLQTPLVAEHDVDRIVDGGHYRALAPNPLWEIPDRQREVLQALADGKRDEEIALQMGISKGSVRMYVQRATTRLRCRTRTQAVAVAVAAGLVSAPTREAVAGDKLVVKRRLLSERQAQVLRLSALGMTRREIANDLGISDETVKNHVSGLLDVLGAYTQAHAVAIAFGTGRLAFSDSRHTGR